MENDVSLENGPYCNDYMYPFHVFAVTSHGKKPLVLGTFYCIQQRSLLRCGDEDWKVMTDISSSSGAICLFKGRLYAVDKTGRTVTVEPDSSVRLMSEPLVAGGHRKILVESEGQLLLADVCINFPGGHDPITIDFFKLNEKEKKWVKLRSLGDRVLILGEVGSFSFSASDLCVSKGNCVIFMDNMATRPMRCVLDLDEGRFTLLSDSPEYLNLFWPSLEWIVKT